jgi:AcrR family transcriptional regulator
LTSCRRRDCLAEGSDAPDVTLDAGVLAAIAEAVAVGAAQAIDTLCAGCPASMASADVSLDAVTRMAPTPKPMTAELILDVAEDVLRRHGPAKATVVDVARGLGLSHASVYRHFATKAALWEAVTKRWLDQIATALAVIAAEERNPEFRLRDWLASLFAAMRRKSREDPELFATYKVLAAGSCDAIAVHVDDLTAQLAQIVRSGTDHAIFASVTDPTTIARAVFQATGRFHDSCYALDWKHPDVEAQFDAVLELVVQGLRG